MSGPAELMRAIDGRRHLGQGWSSTAAPAHPGRAAHEPTAVAQVERAQQEYAERRRSLSDALAALGVSVARTEGLNIWVPVEDETAAVVRLASQRIGVSAGAPFAALPTPQGHIRVTCGLVADAHNQLAERIADAAQTVSWGARAR